VVNTNPPPCVRPWSVGTPLLRVPATLHPWFPVLYLPQLVFQFIRFSLEFDCFFCSGISLSTVHPGFSTVHPVQPWALVADFRTEDVWCYVKSISYHKKLRMDSTWSSWWKVVPNHQTKNLNMCQTFTQQQDTITVSSFLTFGTVDQ